MDAIEELLTRGVDTIYPTKEALEKVLRSGKKLRLYQGFDPTGIQLHIGHMTGLMKLRLFQNLGHHVIFLIGDGTGQAGDPSGKTRSRDTYLTNTQLRINAKDYVLQAKKIINFEGVNPAEILYNGDWLNKLNLVDILQLSDHFSLQQLEERDIFEKRKKEGKLITFREFWYPLLQGYDSVAMNVDLELGGTDQTFNMLAGRKLVRDYLQKEKFVMTTPLLADKTGKKIGKTEGNVIALTSPPNDLYGMIMNLPDDVVGKCFEMITDVPFEDVKRIQSDLSDGKNPMEYKKKLAFTLTRMLHSEKDAKAAQNYFENTFQKKVLPKHISTFTPSAPTLTILNLVTESGMVSSATGARNLISQGAVEIDGTKITDINQKVDTTSGTIMKIGKHNFIKVK